MPLPSNKGRYHSPDHATTPFTCLRAWPVRRPGAPPPTSGLLRPRARRTLHFTAAGTKHCTPGSAGPGQCCADCRGERTCAGGGVIGGEERGGSVRLCELGSLDMGGRCAFDLVKYLVEWWGLEWCLSNTWVILEWYLSGTWVILPLLFLRLWTCFQS